MQPREVSRHLQVCLCQDMTDVSCCSCLHEDGKLYYVGPKKEEKREVVIEAERKKQIFLDCHFDDIGHHLGQKKTVHRIQSKYYWLGIIRDVVDWVGALGFPALGPPVTSPDATLTPSALSDKSM